MRPTSDRNGYNAALTVEVEPVLRVGADLGIGVPISYAHAFTPIRRRDVSAHGYRLMKEEYRGIDHYGDKNEAEVLTRTEYDSGIGFRVGVSRQFLGRTEISAHYQSDGGLSQLGLSVGWRMPILGTLR